MISMTLMHAHVESESAIEGNPSDVTIPNRPLHCSEMATLSEVFVHGTPRNDSCFFDGNLSCDYKYVS